MLVRLWRASPANTSLAKFAQELLRGHIKRILLKDTADDDHRMRAHNVNYRVASELREMVRADYRIVVATPNIIDA